MQTLSLNSNGNTNKHSNIGRGQECILSKSKAMREHGGRNQRLVITEHNVGLSLTLQGVMNGASPIRDIQAASHQCLWATARYEVINHATWAQS